MAVKSLISVIVPIYNVEKYLARCVDSLLAQDYENTEILLINDGSTDGCGKICDEYSKLDSRVVTYHKENGGLSDARNYGMERAAGEYILFVDSDDYIVSSACTDLLKKAAETDADMVIGHAKTLKYAHQLSLREDYVKQNFDYGKVYSGKEYLLKCLEKSDFRVEVWRSLYKAEFLKNSGLAFEKGVAHEDELFTPAALISANRVALSKAEFYIYDNDRPDSIVNSKSTGNKKALDSLYIYDKLLQLYQGVEPEKLKRRLEDNICWKYLDTVSKYNLAENPEIKLKGKEMLKCAYTFKRRIKALAFAISPRLYCRIF